jgi:putative transposase
MFGAPTTRAVGNVNISRALTPVNYWNAPYFWQTSGFTPHFPQFFTATILEWKHLIKTTKYTDIITESLSYRVKEKRVYVYSFVIMPNHIHLIWQIREGYERQDVQWDFLKHTAQRMISDLKVKHPKVLDRFKVNAKDRTYQIWERNPLSIDLFSEKVLLQKLNYVHQNPLQEKWKLVEAEASYEYSSASFYQNGKSKWDFLSHYLAWSFCSE